MTTQLHVTPIRKHQYDACAILGVKSLQEGLCDDEWDTLMQSYPCDYTLPTGRVMTLVRANRKIEGNVVVLIGWLKHQGDDMTRHQVKQMVQEELGNLIK